jgi:pimeloyl-ACP methyl ester carboxylesterase
MGTVPISPVVSIRGRVDRRQGMKREILSILISLLSASCASPEPKTMSTTTPTTATNPQSKPRSGYAAINGLRYYYEIHGEHGDPLLLLHGGLGSIDMFNVGLPELAKTRQVIAVDLHGHGRTQLGNRKIDYIDQGNDLAVLVEQLGFKQVDVLGYSMGGGIAFRFAVQHPDKVRRLALVSAGFSTEGFYPEMLPMQAQVGAAMLPMMKDTPIYKSYVSIAPDPNEFPKLLDAMGERMRKKYDWSADVAKLTMPVILIVGDSDMFRLEHVVEFYKLLGGGQRDAGWQREHMAKNRLAILPNLTHYEMSASPLTVSTALTFLDGNSNAPTQQVAKQ